MFLTRLDSHKPLGIFFKDGDGEGGGGGGGQDWKDSLPDELKTDASLADVPDVATLAKRFVDTKAMVGGSFRVPSEEAGKEDWATFHASLMQKVPSLMFKPDTSDTDAMGRVYDQLGRPEKPETYTLPEIDSQGLELDMGLAEEFKGIAHKHGLNQRQYEGIVEELTGATIVKSLEARGKVNADVKALADEWGVAYDKNMKLAVAGAERTKAPKQLISLLKSPFPPSDLAKYFHSIATTLGDGEGNPLVTDATSNSVMTPLEAQRQMQEMRANKEHPINNPGDPTHAAAMARFKTLANAAFTEARK